MKFGISLNIHDPERTRPYDQLLDELREMVALCDDNGFDSLWVPEHHFSIWGREMVPNPLLLAADLAARTKRMRIGLSAAIITFWHPLRLAEDLALLDQLTGGRLEIGFGRGNYGLEASNLNPAADPNDQEANFKLFEEAVQVVRTALANDIFSYKGEMFSSRPPASAPTGHTPSATPPISTRRPAN